MNTNEVGDTIDDIDGDDVAERAGQAGLATRGVLYLVSALLTLRVAFGGSSTDEGPGKGGAIRTVAQQPFGRVLVLAIAIGLAGYAVWRFVEAWTYTPDADESTARSWVKRGGKAGRGCIYLVALATAVSLVLSSDSSSEGGGGGGAGGSGDSQSTERVFDLPFGRWIVLAVGLGVLAAAGYNGYRAVSGSYRDKWEGDMSSDERRWAVIVSEAGLVGHMAVFALVGFFLTKSAVVFDPNEPEGLDQAVRSVADASYGTALLVVLALGMVAYAGFSFVEARWRVLV